MAEKHLLANKVGKVENLDEFCVCCSKPVNKSEVELCIPRVELGFLGPLFPLYFKFFLYGMLTLFILFGVNVSNLMNNWGDDYCQTCSGTLYKLTLLNRSDLSVQATFNLASVLVLMLLNQLYFRSMRHSEAMIDSLNNTPSDYTLMISKLPKGEFSEEDIRELIDRFFKPFGKIRKIFDGATINNINMAYNISEFYDKLS